jgi:guanylate kinase
MANFIEWRREDMKKYVVVLTALSSVGKDTILKDLVRSGNYTNIISHTTRPIRNLTEQNHVDYHFVDESEFKKTPMIEERHYNTVHGKWLYGMSEKEMFDKLNSDKLPIVILDYNGYVEFKEWCDDKDITLIPFYIKASFVRRTYRAYKRGNFNLKEWIRREIADRKSFKGASKNMINVKNLDIDKCVRLIHDIVFYTIEGDK